MFIVWQMELCTGLWVCKSLIRSTSIPRPPVGDTNHEIISSQLLGQNLVYPESVPLPAPLKSSQCSFVHVLPLLILLLALKLP